MSALKIIPKILFFTFSKEDLASFNKSHFFIGLTGTWLAGIGRYWDHPDAELLQYAGLGSVIYIFILALLIYIIVWPYRLKGCTYFNVLTFISLTSFPALLYAIPAEKFLSLTLAATLNAWFLGIVALWRLALLFRYLKLVDDLKWWNVFFIALFPMCLLISALTILNLEKVVFDLMAGLRNTTGREKAYAVLLTLTYYSVMLFVPLLIGYITGIIVRNKKSGSKNLPDGNSLH
jgi:hypothetical protein